MSQMRPRNQPRRLSPHHLAELDATGQLDDVALWLRAEMQAAVVAGKPLSPEADRVVRRALDRLKREAPAYRHATPVGETT